MIETKDLFEDGLFDGLIKDSITLAKALDSVEVQLKELAKTTGKLDTKDAFKSYDKVKGLEKDISTLEVAVKGLTEIESQRNLLVKESINLTKKYEEELSSIADENDKITLSLAKQSAAFTKENAEIEQLNSNLEKNSKRQVVLVNSIKAVQSFQTKNTKATVESIKQYRIQEKEIKDSIKVSDTLQRSLARTTTQVKSISQALSAKSSNFLDSFLTSVRKFTSPVNEAKTKIQELKKKITELGGDNGFVIAGSKVGKLLDELEKVEKELLKLLGLKGRLLSMFKLLGSGIKGVTSGIAGFGKGVAQTAVGNLVSDLGTTLINAFVKGRAAAADLQQVLQLLASTLVNLLDSLVSSLSFFSPSGGVVIPDLSGAIIKDAAKSKKAIEDYKTALTGIGIGFSATDNEITDALSSTNAELLTTLNLLRQLEAALKAGNLPQAITLSAGLPDSSLRKSVRSLALLPTGSIAGKAVLGSTTATAASEVTRARAIIKLRNDSNISSIKNVTPGFKGAFEDLTPASTGVKNELLAAQFAVDGLVVSLVELNSEYERLSKVSTDGTLSLTKQREAFNQLEAASLKLKGENTGVLSGEAGLAEAQLKLARLTIVNKLALRTDLADSAALQARARSLSIEDITGGSADAVRLAGLLEQQDVDQFIAALNAKTAAEKNYNARRADLATIERQNLSDDLELTLDALIDNTDKIKTINETAITDETRTITERQKILDDTTALTTKAYDDQVQALIDFRKKINALGGTGKLDLATFSTLLGITDISELDKQVRALGFSEIITTRIFEIIKERQQTVADLRTLKGGLDLSALNIKFTDEDLAVQAKFLKELERQNNLIREQIAGNTPDTAQDLFETEQKLIKADELIVTYGDIALQEQIRQAAERLDIAKNAGLETAELAKSLQDLLLAQELSYLEKQRKQKEDAEAKLKDDAEKSSEELQKVQTDRLAKQLEIQQAAFSLLNALNEKVANDRLAKIDREIAAVSEREGYLISLAEKGSENLTENLAFEQKKQAELEAERDRIDKARARRALAISIFETYSANLNALQAENVTTPGSHPNPGAEALTKTAIDASILQALVNALPSFYEGVEDTGNGGGLDDKNGFLAVLHPHERVLTAQQNKSILGYSNDEVVQRVKSVPSNNLEHKLDELIKVTKDKEVYLGSDYSAISKTLTETIKSQGKLTRIHNRTDSIF
jgi:hypothetical protein